jgi:alpha-glucoside transport system permease protein
MSGEDAFLFEVTPRHDVRVPRKWHLWTRTRARAWGYLLPAAALAGLFLIVPLAATALTGLTSGGGPGHFADILRRGDVWLALRNTAGWLGLSAVVCALGLGLALLYRGLRPWLRRLLLISIALPAVASPLTAGIAFRLIFDVAPERGVLNAVLPHPVLFLGPGWIWLVLGSAFVWQWTGVAFLVFQAGLSRVPGDLLRVARVLGMDPPRVWRLVKIPALFPTAALAFLIVLTAAARVFGLVLVGAPGSMQAAVDVVGLYWWRHQDELGAGGSSALATLQFAVAAVVALLVLWRLRRELPDRRPLGAAPAPPPAPARGRSAAAIAMPALWLVPFAILVLTSLRTPVAAATSGFWTGGYGTGSYRDAFGDGSFAAALAHTFRQAIIVVTIVLLAAVPAAYALTHSRLPYRAGRVIVGVATTLAVLPPQVLARPLGEALGGGIGNLAVLGAVYAAMVLPLAVLILRNAFASVPHPVIARVAPGRSALPRMMVESGPAIVAVSVLAFVLAWNDLVIGLLLNWPTADQVPLILLQQARQFITSAGQLAAQGTVATAVPAALVLLTGPWLVRGLTLGVRR